MGGMNLTPLGATELMVPRLCLGTMYFGTHVFELARRTLLET